MPAPASSLQARLLEAAVADGVMRVLPFWADGGSASDDPVFRPSRHVLAAYPTTVQRAHLADLGPGGLVPYLRSHLPLASPSPLPLVVVALAFDAGRAVLGHEGLFERPRRRSRHPHDALPEVVIARYDGYLLAPSEAGPWSAVGDAARLVAALAHPPLTHLPMSLGPLRDPLPGERYLEGFAAIQEGIAAGDYYQVNLARRLQAPLRGSCSRAALAATAGHLYLAMREAQPTAFGAIMPLDEGAWLISGSPECLLQWDSQTRVAQSFPIKGTIGRGLSAAADASFEAALRASAKDRAEHVMIVDLVRNDLGRVAVPGTVSVASLLTALPLRTVRHLVSEVRARVSPRHDLADLVGALFPGGSITGAPKIAAIKALDRCEPFHRGYYCGSLGVVFGGQGATFSILIRTALLSAHGLTYATGGALVADSDPLGELAETALKALALEVALGSAPPGP